MEVELSATSARLRAWAEMTAAMGREAHDPGAMLRILADGVRRVLEAQFSAVVATVEPAGVVEVRAVAGVGASGVTTYPDTRYATGS